MKILFSFFLLVSLSTSTYAEYCNLNGYFTNQSAVDNFVNNLGTCNSINSLYLRYDLDYSGLAVLDSVCKFEIYLDAGINSFSFDGLENIIYVEDVTIWNYSVSNALDDIADLDIQEVSGTLWINNVDITNCNFIANLDEVEEIRITNCPNSSANPISFDNLVYVNDLLHYQGTTNSTLPLFPVLESLDNLYLRDYLDYTDPIPFPALDSIHTRLSLYFVENITSTAGMFDDIYISEIESYINNPSFVELDIEEVLGLNNVTIFGSSITSTKLPDNQLSYLALQLPNVADYDFLSHLDTLNHLVLLSTSLSNLAEFANIHITERLKLSNTNLESLNGFSFSSELESVEISNNNLLIDVSELDSISNISNTLGVTQNDMLDFCCALEDVFDSIPPLNLNIYGNGTSCTLESITGSYCADPDEDDIYGLLDNCPEIANPDQLDSDEDGVGDVCDLCPVYVDVSLQTQQSVDDFMVTYEGCGINNLYIEDNIDDLRPLLGLTVIHGNLSIEETPYLQSLDGLESLKRVEGSISLYNTEGVINLNGLEGLEYIGADLTLLSVNLIQRLNDFENLDTIGGNVNINSNFRLTNCCGISPFITGDKYIGGSVTVNGNTGDCTSTSAITAVCGDTDGDGIVDLNDNCPLISNSQQYDQDNDGVGGVCDNCPLVYNPAQGNQDGDLLGDDCDLCPELSTSISADVDANNNGVGDPCEGDAGSDNGFVGLGTVTPNSKLEIKDGDVYIPNIHRGVILQSPDGSCYRIKMQNDGTLSTIPMDCPE